MKKIGCLFLILIMIASIGAGCTNTTTASATGATTAATTKANATTATTATTVATTKSKELIEYKAAMWWETQANLAFDKNLVSKKVKELFNIVLNYTYISPQDWDTKLSLLFAGNQYPDWLHNGYSRNAEEFGPKGYLVDINTVLSKMPNYAKLFSSDTWANVLKMMTSSDGKLYFIPTSRTFGPTNAWVYRADIFEKLNLSFPKTTDELYDALVKIKQAYPQMVPYSNRNSFGGLSSGFYNAFRINPGMDGFYFDKDANAYVYGAKTDKFKNMVKYLNKLYAANLVEKEFPTISGDQWTARHSKGEIGIEYGYANWVPWLNTYDKAFKWQWVTSMVTAYPDKPANLPGKVVLAQEFGPILTNALKGDKLDRLLEYFNWACSEEGAFYHCFGELGVTYEKVNGKNMFLKQADGNIINYNAFGLSYFIWDYPPRHDSSERAQVDREMGLYWEKSAPQENRNPLVFYFFTGEEKKAKVDLLTHLKEVFDQYAIKFVMNNLNPNDDANWQKFYKELDDAGLKTIYDMYKARYEKDNK